MADITKCATTTCPTKELCYRYTAPPDDIRQSWMDFTPYVTLWQNRYECRWFMPAYRIVSGNSAAAKLHTD